MYTAEVVKDEDMYVATCRETGTVSQGFTVKHAVANLKEATELYLESYNRKEKVSFTVKNIVEA